MFPSHDPSEVTNEFSKQFHKPRYEDNTKLFVSNYLLNYNLISYPHESQTIQNIGYIRNVFDQLPTTLMSVDRLMNEFPNRMQNFTGSVSEIRLKQTHIFDIHTDTPSKDIADFPYYYKKTFGAFLTNNSLNTTLVQYGKLKNFLQSIKKDLSFLNRSFNIENNTVQAKIYNATNLLTPTSLI